MKGFTLIETIIYAAIVTMIMLFSIFTLYQVIHSSEKIRTQAEIHEELNFILGKLNYAITGADYINSPAQGTTGTTLSITKTNFGSNPLVFDLLNSDVRLKEGSSAALPLDNTNVIVDSITFQHLPATPYAPRGIKTVITVHASTYTETISAVNYLRK